MSTSKIVAELIGWASSAVLIATLIRQVFSQWQSGSVGGLSKWLFIGQMTASVGFAVYSFLLKNWVFAASNVAILAVALLGEIIYAKNRRKKRAFQPR